MIAGSMIGAATAIVALLVVGLLSWWPGRSAVRRQPGAVLRAD